MYFSDDESRRLNTRIRELEKETGIELVAAVVGKCDHYPEIPWKAFALGVAFSALVLLFQTTLRPDWPSSYTVLLHAGVLLGTGTLAALLTMVWPGWARCLLNKTRAEGEIHQYAQSLFLEHEVFRVPDRSGILLLIGLFERQVVILPDLGIGSRLPEAALGSVIDAMGPLLKQGDRLQALTKGLSVLETHLKATGFTAREDDADRIPEALIQQKGGADA
jgi:putative membrane protein